MNTQFQERVCCGASAAGDMGGGDGGGSSAANNATTTTKRLTIAFIGAKSVGKTSIIRVSSV